MEQHLQEISDQQKASWNKFSLGWKKWDTLMMDFLLPMGEKIISGLNLKDTDHVLDIASGTGEPGLTIASLVKNGKVVLTDLADEMLLIARENAANRGITNVEFIPCDVSKLPFPDASFDVVSCRLGFMFFPDMQLAANEMFRVLKPGGRVVTSVWDVAEKNFWITAIGGTINRNMDLPAPAPGAPGMFRCAEPGLMERIFSNAGSKNTSVYGVKGIFKFGTAEVYWNMLTEVAAPFVGALSQADDALRQKIKEEVFETIRQKYPDGNVNIDGNSFVVCGTK